MNPVLLEQTLHKHRKIAFSDPSDLTLDRLSDWILTLK